MPHKLRIKMVLNPFSGIGEEGKKFLQERFTDRDMIRGQPCEISFEITNIGEKPFPGSTFEDVYHFSDDFTSTPAPAEIPSIGVGETKTIKRMVVPLNNGGGFVRARLKSRDGEEIEAYQRRPDVPIGRNEWQDVFYVVPRESIDLIWFLAKLSARRES